MTCPPRKSPYLSWVLSEQIGPTRSSNDEHAQCSDQERALDSTLAVAHTQLDLTLLPGGASGVISVLLRFVSSLEVLVRFSMTCPYFREAVIKAPGVCQQWALQVSRLPSLSMESPGKRALDAIRWVDGFDVSGSWKQHTLPSADMPGCTFVFQLSLAALPTQALQKPPLDLEINDPWAGCVGLPRGYEGTGIFQAQHVGIPFRVVGWVRGVHFCYHVVWEGHASTTMHCTMPLFWDGLLPCKGGYREFFDDTDATQREGEFLLARL
mmetsp:Transcript_46354/g.119126  ORF Transcript_46354/g.119126 Transcript_46354/m.119126 type:complete len:267 (-) Transcript_46354:160-960(-)